MILHRHVADDERYKSSGRLQVCTFQRLLPDYNASNSSKQPTINVEQHQREERRQVEGRPPSTPRPSGPALCLAPALRHVLPPLHTLPRLRRRAALRNLRVADHGLEGGRGRVVEPRARADGTDRAEHE